MTYIHIESTLTSGCQRQEQRARRFDVASRQRAVRGASQVISHRRRLLLVLHVVVDTPSPVLVITLLRVPSPPLVTIVLVVTLLLLLLLVLELTVLLTLLLTLLLLLMLLLLETDAAPA